MHIVNYYITKFLEENCSKISGSVLTINSTGKDLSKILSSLNIISKIVSQDEFVKTGGRERFDTVIAINFLNKCPDYEVALESLVKSLNKNGNLILTNLSIADDNRNMWGFTKPSLKIVLSRYFDINNLRFKVYGNAMSGRMHIVKKNIGIPALKSKMLVTDEHFSVLVGTVASNPLSKPKEIKHINILVDEERYSLKGRVAAYLKRTSYVLDGPLLIARRFRSIINRLTLPRKTYLSLQTTEPATKNYGFSRGKPIDRYYIEAFLEKNKMHIKGYCLEIVDNTYTRRFGGKNVVKSDALDIFPSSRANIQGDLRKLTNVNSNTYDCLVVTQTLFLIDDYMSAIKECRRILKPGGVLLVTLCAFSPTWNISVNLWRFSQKSAKEVFGKVFGSKKVTVEGLGNIEAAVGFWSGLAQEDYSEKELTSVTNKFSMIVGVVARK